MAPIDVFIDLSRVHPSVVQSAMARLDSAECFREIDARVTCAAPSSGVGTIDSHWRIEADPPVDVCNRAISAAAEAERPLLVLLDDIAPRADALGVLLDGIDSDPMIGFARPRVALAPQGGIARLDHEGDAAIQELPRRILAELPATYLVADAPGRCLLVRPVVLANFGELDARFHSLAGALWHFVGAHAAVAIARSCATAPSWMRRAPRSSA